MDPMTILLAVGIGLWLAIVAIVFAVCRAAGDSDAELLGESPHIPRRASTCGTVRMRILKSPQSDQFATYK